MSMALPFRRSYWAIPGKLLAGVYPGDLDPGTMATKLASLLDAGVTLVVNLMEADELDHSGQPFVGYQSQLEKLAGEAGLSARFVRFAIPDMSIPTPDLMARILAEIRVEIDRGGTVYVHCWGGKGRTATVVGCFLVEAGVTDGDGALSLIRDLTAHAKDAFWPTPQTEEQCAFVRHWRSRETLKKR